MAGRGSGKTYAGAHYVNTYASKHPGVRIAVIAPTLGDARSICVEGDPDAEPCCIECCDCGT